MTIGVGIIEIIILIAVFLRKSSSTPSTNLTPTVTTAPYAKEDINQDGVINEVDANFVKTNMNCKQADPCWNKVIGKTLSGENPIYASDLDFNHDGIITEVDLNIDQSKIGH